MAANPSNPSKMVIFVLQTKDRQRQTIENDMVLMVNTVQAANKGDFIQGFAASGSEIFAFKAENQNQLQFIQAKNRAISDIRSFFLNLFNENRSPKGMANKDSDIVDVASSIAKVMERFNYAPSQYQRMVLVLLSDGLQRDRAISFKGLYPSDSWIVHELSPFSAIRVNSTKTKLDVVFLPQRTDYANGYHASKIERWYSLLFQRKQAQLIGFVYEHQSAAELIARGGSPSQKVLDPVNIYGPLFLNRAEGLTGLEEDDDNH